MELLLSKLLEKSTEGSPDEVITKRDIQTVVEESKHAASDDQKTNTNNQGNTDK